MFQIELVALAALTRQPEPLFVDADMDAAARFFLHFFANVCFILNDLNAVVKRKLTYPFYLSCFLYS